MEASISCDFSLGKLVSLFEYEWALAEMNADDDSVCLGSVYRVITIRKFATTDQTCMLTQRPSKYTRHADL